MYLWRICPRAYAATALDGLGGLYASARWHEKGHPIVYTGTSRALAALEVLVHVSRATAPSGLRLLTIDLPDTVSLETLDPATLPAGWNVTPGPASLRALGVEWLTSLRSVALVVPSAVISAERNVLLNPRHPDMGRVTVVEDVPFAFDSRLT